MRGALPERHRRDNGRTAAVKGGGGGASGPGAESRGGGSPYAPKCEARRRRRRLRRRHSLPPAPGHHAPSVRGHQGRRRAPIHAHSAGEESSGRTLRREGKTGGFEGGAEGGRDARLRRDGMRVERRRATGVRKGERCTAAASARSVNRGRNSRPLPWAADSPCATGSLVPQARATAGPRGTASLRLWGVDDYDTRLY